METRADQQQSVDDPSPPPAAYPRWVLLEYFIGCNDPDAKTVAHARTSKGRPIRVSLGLAEPPAVSRLRVDSPGLPDGVSISGHVFASHGDSVLVKIQTRNDGTASSYCEDRFMCDYFIYCAGDAAGDPSRPPSLSLLPPCYLTDQNEGWGKDKRYMDVQGTTLLRRGHDEVLVAVLNFLVKDEESPKAELCLLRSGNWEWELKLLPIIHDEGKRKEISCWVTDKAIPVGDRFLFWVDYFRGIIYSNVWEETPELRYVSLPVEPDPRRVYANGRVGLLYRSVCATDGGGVRFVEVSPRCCCGCPGTTECARSRYAFSITTWALRMDDMTTWDKVSVVDCLELWSLPGYHGVVPRIRPQYPIVSLDDPDVLHFMVRKHKYMDDVEGDLAIRLIKFDTRRMELRSIFYYDKEYCSCPDFLVSAVSQYLDASPRSRNLARQKDIELEKSQAMPSKSTLPGVAAMASPQEMLAVIREIPDLARDDMLKAYGVLAWDETQFKFRSLLALPMDMRKDYCRLIGNFSYFHV